MKAQTGIEFIVSTMIFLLTITYATLTIINNMPVYHDYAVTEDLITRSYQMSEYIVFDYLASTDRYVIDSVKKNALVDICEGSGVDTVIRNQNIRDEFDLDSKDIILTIKEVDDPRTQGTENDLVINCRSTASSISKEITVRRYAIYDNNIVSVEVAVV
ncbi:hypothetical protein CL614_07470 [archaeon]|nr:hypothetical protein [archaeon]|tara:strand:- start:3065 stop:3541 length:477 start_codon:yes stop_codon:yes gene_type:complete